MHNTTLQYTLNHTTLKYMYIQFESKRVKKSSRTNAVCTDIELQMFSKIIYIYHSEILGFGEEKL